MISLKPLSSYKIGLFMNNKFIIYLLLLTINNCGNYYEHKPPQKTGAVNQCIRNCLQINNLNIRQQCLQKCYDISFP